MDFVPEIGGAATSGIGLANGAEARAGVLAETIEFFEGEAALDLDVIDLRKIGPGFKHGGGEVAIVGEKDEAGVGVVEGADGINAFGEAAEEIAECAAAFGIGERGNDFGRFVEEQVDVILFGFDEAAGGFDLVFGGIGFGAEFGDDDAVDADLAGEDELFGVAARGDAGVGDDFLEAVEHGEEGYQRSDSSDPEPGSSGWWLLETFYNEIGWGGGKWRKKDETYREGAEFAELTEKRKPRGREDQEEEKRDRGIGS